MTPRPAEPAHVDQPRHPVHALATFELADYRRRLERAIASLGTRNPAPPVLADLRAMPGVSADGVRWLPAALR